MNEETKIWFDELERKKKKKKKKNTYVLLFLINFVTDSNFDIYTALRALQKHRISIPLYFINRECKEIFQYICHVKQKNAQEKINYYIFMWNNKRVHTEKSNANNIWAAPWQNYPNGMCAHRELRTAWASAQSDQSLRCALNG